MAPDVIVPAEKSTCTCCWIAPALLTTATLVVGAQLWEPVVAPGSRKQVLLFNIATVVTVVIGVAVLYAALFVLALIAAFWFVVPNVFRDAVGHPASLRDYLELAWLTCSLAMIGGALGAALESNAAVRDALAVGLGLADQRCKACAERLDTRNVEAVVDLAGVD